jgi:hypothetical protein
LQYPIDIAQDVRIPKPQDAISFRGKEGIADLIVGAFRVLPAIYFNDELAVSTEEIDDVGSNRFLTHKFEASQPPIAHSKPELRFSIGGVSPQLADSIGALAIRSAHQMPLTRLAPSALATLSPLRGARVRS